MSAGQVYGRTFDAARERQGFVSQAHLDAFYASVDHDSTCKDCADGWAWNGGDASWQTVRKPCPVAASLWAAYLAVSK